MAEKEYIEREAVLTYMSEVKAACISNFEYEASAVIAGMIGEIKDDEIPTADVAPVRHGCWKRELMSPKIGLYGYICSNCNKLIYVGIGRYMAYCGNCGAKMDGGD